jgi:hypothetical protein
MGTALAMANMGKSSSELNFCQGLCEVLNRRDSGDFHRELAKIAAAAYAHDGMEGSMQFRLFTKLASEETWFQEFNRFTTPVLTALNKLTEREAGMNKSAATAAAAGGVLAGAQQLPPVLKLLLSVGAIGGIGAGSLGFLLSRDARESSAENNAITEKTRAYKQLRRDIEEDLAATGALDDKKEKERYAL